MAIPTFEPILEFRPFTHALATAGALRHGLYPTRLQFLHDPGADRVDR